MPPGDAQLLLRFSEAGQDARINPAPFPNPALAPELIPGPHLHKSARVGLGASAG